MLGVAQAWLSKSFGWYYMVVIAAYLVFVVGLAFSSYGKLKLGSKDDTLDFSYGAWAGMLFSSGIGISLLYFGASEPLDHYFNPPEGAAASNMAARQCRHDLPFSLRWELQRSAELWGYALAYQPQGLHYVYGMALRKALAQGDEVAAVGDDFSVNDIPLHGLGGYRQKVGAAALARLPAYLQQGRTRALRRAARNQIGRAHV